MQRAFSLLALLGILVMTGCFHSKKNPPPKENPKIATQMEIEFMQRFVDKRTTELVAQGMTPLDARTRATAEFKARYSYTAPAQK